MKIEKHNFEKNIGFIRWGKREDRFTTGKAIYISRDSFDKKVWSLFSISVWKYHDEKFIRKGNMAWAMFKVANKKTAITLAKQLIKKIVIDK